MYQLAGGQMYFRNGWDLNYTDLIPSRAVKDSKGFLNFRMWFKKRLANFT